MGPAQSRRLKATVRANPQEQLNRTIRFVRRGGVYLRRYVTKLEPF